MLGQLLCWFGWHDWDMDVVKVITPVLKFNGEAIMSICRRKDCTAIKGEFIRIKK